MSWEGLEIKAYGRFIVSPTRFEVDEPEDFPAIFGGSYEYPDKSSIIADFIVIRNRKEYEEFVQSLKEVYERISGKDVDKTLVDLEIDMKLRAFAKEYTTIRSDEDYEILKAGWQLGVKRYDKESRISGIAGYDLWPEYSGLDKTTSEQINAYLWDLAFKQKKFELDEIVADLKKRFGLDEKQAELIVRTEFANIFNKMREWAYLEKTDVKKFKWITSPGACERCLKVAEESKKGVTLEELKELIQKYGGKDAREWTVHPNCRCTFIRKAGKRRRWE